LTMYPAAGGVFFACFVASANIDIAATHRIRFYRGKAWPFWRAFFFPTTRST
jgi:hypothetical protein